MAGFFSPGQSAYNHEATLSYACHAGLKPAVKGWWGTSRCQNGNWSPNPQCIDEKACMPLTIPNGNYDASTDGWYKDGGKIRVRCEEGYEHKDHDATAQCINGIWSSVPICERSTESCGDPPKIPHAVIIGKGYQEVFAVNSQLQCKCEDGYVAEGADTKTISCISGNWTEGPTCSVGDTTVTEPVSGVDTCGTPPPVANGEVVKNTGRYLRYRCAAHYELVGPKMVECYSNGTWSEAPTCKATYCSVNTGEVSHVKSVGVRLINDGEEEHLECSRSGTFFDHFSEARCTRGKVKFSECCNKLEIRTGLCNDRM
ncbi:complement factor H-related protein 5-like isoform X1 [Trematomus bernacchii]|uniref:complement factor H-related protein 5-like isoform X1 n=1 Tax=Trematomus bernacchii TaxID=40690 RepID=UPI00146BD1E5|nr:complement factor H-related protein 5-like isoform X1 [Trematomus bernacchii]